ncbi:unnamed protein product [Peronospora destructor]|uniref:SGNH hydrolase-type esterase domain-containing protein n=1 Tax=Peronospora destructor TaxID=86335 RepID=A0AAV0T920_9STRA|nr:unnamed protein product [Peronospora destructor]
MGLTLSSERRPVFYFIGNGSNPCKNGFITVLQNHMYAWPTVLIAIQLQMEHGPDKTQYMSLQEYRANLQKILQTVQPLLAPDGQVLLITPPCIIHSMRHNDCSNASAAKYAKVCVDLATAENVHVLDLHTYFNATFPDENVRKRYFVDGLHFSKKGNKKVGKLLEIAINGMFDKEELNKLNKWRLPDWQALVPHAEPQRGKELVSHKQ